MILTAQITMLGAVPRNVRPHKLPPSWTARVGPAPSSDRWASLKNLNLVSDLLTCIGSGSTLRACHFAVSRKSDN